MATVTATITVDFISNYTGDHRICWRLQGTTSYDCSTIVNCPGGGQSCQGIFTVDVNTTSCDGPVVIEGYVQAACESEASTVGRIPFSVTYTPSPTCIRQEVTCARTGILDVLVTNGGINYQVSDTVVITRDPNDTATQDATLEISSVDVNGSIVGFNILNPGLYEYPPTITVSSGTGSGFEPIVATLEPCPAFTLTDCSGNASSNIILDHSEMVAICSESILSLPQEFDITQNGCCVATDTTSDACHNYDVTNNDVADVTIQYTACNGIYSEIIVNPGVTTTICAVLDSIVDPNNANVVITDTGIACQ